MTQTQIRGRTSDNAERTIVLAGDRKRRKREGWNQTALQANHENDAAIAERVAAAVGTESFGRYFDRHARISLDAAGLEIRVPNEFLAGLIERRFGSVLRSTARECLTLRGKDDHKDGARHEVSGAGLRILVDRSVSGGSSEGASPREDARSNGAESGGGMPRRRGAAGKGLAHSIRAEANPIRHRLEEFLVGSSNKLAFAAAERLANGDESCRVIFIHGACGMGKTHLLQGVAARFIERNPGASVRYTTAEAFTNDYVSAVRANRIEPFRRVYRRVDLLCLDDVHFFSKKEATQTELLHTFDAIGMDGARLLFASDEHPRDISDLNSHLTSRLMGAGVIRIDPPDPELRARLIRKLGAKRGMVFEDAAVALIVERSARGIGTLGGFGGSVRELDGMVIQVEAVAKLLPEFAGQNGSIGALLVKKALGLDEQPKARARRPISADAIAEEVCRVLGVDRNEFLSSCRHRRLVFARGMAAYLCRKLTTLSFPEVAKAYGRPNHSSIVTSFRRFETQVVDGVPIHGEIVEKLPVEARVGQAAELADLVMRKVVSRNG